ncbi:alkaline phosphatase synthesis sensor protein PhoR [Peptoclostridium acidaminophilum DSM 3953]|uniref:histidine kinase n=1 Tax=Peptoclostridium acidaminophilum DSM 3953 TaxID=1286171 RepID=W8T2R6_PEPAC|nr:ATP-binding protein [Peptoclostridium acidaminophilum]AHM56039.1 alkaline phosphatase synthesis sensor protein PhoR [Peptoclostridium acidaminophilum DSM 3953]
MRRLFSNKKIIFMAIIFLYILGQLMGTFVIKEFFINYKIKEMLPRLMYIAGEIGSGNSTIPKNTDFILKAYDVYGAEMNIFNDKVRKGLEIPEDVIYKSLVNHIPEVIAGNKVAILERIGNDSVESIVIGAPIVKNREVAGAVFLLKPASDFNAILNGFYLIFSVTLILGVSLIGMFLNLHLKEIKQLEQTRRDYIANVSHELKSPIASIRALTETLADNVIQDEETKAKYYGIILKESRNLQRLISDMLELSRLQSGRTAYEKKNINGGAFMRDLYEKYSVIIGDIDIAFKVTETAMNLPDIYTSRERLLQIFNILIDNAIKFIHEDGIIVVDAEIHRKHIKFSVSDNGIGIEKSGLPYIFDRFYKEDNAGNNGGSGLGLSIAKEIISGLGEEIWVSSEYGKGATFSFTVQRA